MQFNWTEKVTWIRAFGILSLIAILPLSGCQVPTVAPLDVTSIKPGPNERVEVDRVVLLLDASGSIDWQKQFPDAKAQWQSFAAAMPEGNYDVALIEFGGNDRDTLSLAKHTPAQVAQKVSSVKHLGEDTPLPDVIAEAGSVIAGKRGRTAVVLFSDGVATRWGRSQAPNATIASAKKAIKGQSGEVCFHTYQLGEDPEGKVLLEQLAAVSNCGSYATASSLATSSALYAAERSIFIGALPPVAAAPARDSDGDGVTDARDQCPGTPRGAAVDSRGCWVLGNLTYDLDSAAITRGQNAELDAVIEVMQSNPKMKIRIDGHTDSSGAASYNMNLSERRADGVRSYLTNAGVEAERLQIRGHGESDPIADNSSQQGRAKNRRSELSVIEE